jgi:hypothetical protein
VASVSARSALDLRDNGVETIVPVCGPNRGLMRGSDSPIVSTTGMVIARHRLQHEGPTTNERTPGMRCPLCGGPVQSDGDRFACELGHEVGPGELRRFTDHQLAEALWMAVQALDNEAAVLRVLDDADGRRFADEAEAQAALLREFAHHHAPRVNDDSND